jgi:hypothetical protein
MATTSPLKTAPKRDKQLQNKPKFELFKNGSFNDAYRCSSLKREGRIDIGDGSRTNPFEGRGNDENQ